jgi:anti-sigma-K factor RskA
VSRRIRYDRPELRDRLAAAYALGTLQGPARRRMERLMRKDEALAAAVEAWQLRLNPLVEAMPPVEPPARLWAAIEREIASSAQLDPSIVAFPTPGARNPNRVAVAWRAFGLTAVAIAASLAVYIAVREPAATTDTSSIAVLSDETGHAAFVVAASRDRKHLFLARVGGAHAPTGRTYQLWLLPHGVAPRSLGLVPDLHRAAFELAVEDARRLAAADGLAISLEPAGGSPTGLPTGPILFKGGVIAD